MARWTGGGGCATLAAASLSHRPMPPPVTPLDLVERAIALRSPMQEAALARALDALAADDPGLIVRRDLEAGHVLICGQSETQLAAAIAALRGDPALDLEVGQPQVAYRETLGRPIEIDYTHKHSSGGARQYARVRIAFAPTGRGSGYRFEDRTVGGSVPRAFIAAVERGLALARQDGLLAGFALIDFKAALIDGGHHQLQSSADAFAAAAVGAFQALRGQAEPVLLEPVIGLEVAANGADMSAIASDLERRGARVLAEFVEGEARTLTASAPMANLFGYAADLAGLSNGRASVVMRFRGYEPVSMSAAALRPPLAAPKSFDDGVDFGWPSLIAPHALPAPADPANDR